MSEIEAEKYETPRDRILKLHEELCKEARVIMRKKGIDYAADSEPFQNFMGFGREQAPWGILHRISDRVQRLSNFVRRGKYEYSADGFRVDCADLINFIVLLLALLIADGLVVEGKKCDACGR